MSTLAVTITPGYTFVAGELLTVEKLNALGNPTVQLIGTISSTFIADGAITTAKLATPVLTKDTLGHSKMEDGYLSADSEGLEKMEDGFLQATTPGREKMADGYITLAHLSDEARVGAGSAGGTYKSLTCKSNVAQPLYKVDITVEDIVVKHWDDDIPICVPGTTSLVLDMTVVGANGLDVGFETANQWYYIWVVYNPTTATAAGVFSVNPTLPTFPSGYEYIARVGVVYNNASSEFVPFWQADKDVWTAEQELLKPPAAGVTAYTLLNLSAFVPPNARVVGGNAGTDSAIATDHCLAVAGDATGTLGVTTLNLKRSGVNLNSFSMSAPYRVPLATAQTMWWKGDVVTASIFRIHVNHYEL